MAPEDQGLFSRKNGAKAVNKIAVEISGNWKLALAPNKINPAFLDTIIRGK
jgi:hypothetical protein